MKGTMLGDISIFFLQILDEEINMYYRQEYLEHIPDVAVRESINVLYAVNPSFDFKFDQFRKYFANPETCPISCDRCARRSQYPTFRDQARERALEPENQFDDKNIFDFDKIMPGGKRRSKWCIFSNV